MASVSPPSIRAIYNYEYKKGISVRATADNINSVFGSNNTVHSTVSYWFNRFASGDFSFEDKERPGRPPTLINTELINTVKANPTASVAALSKTLRCCPTTVSRRLDQLGYRKILAKWIPHTLIEPNKASRVNICESLLLSPHRKNFLKDLVTGDESWILYVNYSRRRKWLPRGEHPEPEPKPDIHTRNNHDELKSHLDQYFASRPPDFWAKGIEMLPKCWEYVIGHDGGYIVD
ncbi:hypothetical protein OESDEN_05977 [Oesophagostomum dentatum]|uniref:Mos1 transposase HTH domain-containing protein n=1 Tax=Oesophagostomum dentatum TaxID=61180 RepID=A0A0B1TA30_OESDE|nr:hypothetical protein OESDEN_05977 [Oesophagostomum dentatum]